MSVSSLVMSHSFEGQFSHHFHDIWQIQYFPAQQKEAINIVTRFFVILKMHASILRFGLHHFNFVC